MKFISLCMLLFLQWIASRPNTSPISPQTVYSWFVTSNALSHYNLLNNIQHEEKNVLVHGADTSSPKSLIDTFRGLTTVLSSLGWADLLPDGPQRESASTKWIDNQIYDINSLS